MSSKKEKQSEKINVEEKTKKQECKSKKSSFLIFSIILILVAIIAIVYVLKYNDSVLSKWKDNYRQLALQENKVENIESQIYGLGDEGQDNFYTEDIGGFDISSEANDIERLPDEETDITIEPLNGEGNSQSSWEDENIELLSPEEIVSSPNKNGNHSAKEESIIELEQEVQTLKDDINKIKEDNKKAYLALSLVNLSNRIKAGEPFSVELYQTKAFIGEKNANMMEMLNRLEGYSTTGIATEKEVVEQFNNLDREIRNLVDNPSSNAAIGEVVKHNVSKFIKIKRTDEKIQSSIDDTLDATQELVRNRQYREAILELKNIPNDEIQNKINDWTTITEQYLEVNYVLNELFRNFESY